MSLIMVYGAVPPEIVPSITPLSSSKQASAKPLMVWVMACGSVMVTSTCSRLEVQLFVSVTVTV